MAEKVLIFDTTLRDGEQSPGASLNKQEKLIIARQLAKLNVDIIEAGFPVSSNDDFEAVKQIAMQIKGPVICGLARTIKKDIDRTWEAVKYSDKPRIHVFVATSKIHMDKKLKKTEQEIIEMIKEMIAYAKSLCPDIEFSPEDASRTDAGFMIKAIETAIKSGATTINIPDTVGYAEPEEFGKRIKLVLEKLKDLIIKKNVVISVHCHNDLGNAVANSLAAVRAGARQVECTINGIGERAGNCALEEVVMNLETRKDYFNLETNINIKEIFKTSKIVSELTNLEVQRNKAIVGRNAFAHEAGIHQHGMIKDKSTYEIMVPEDVGWLGESFVIGKHSGKNAIEKILKENGYDFEEAKIREITKKLKELADIKKDILKKDILEIANNLNKKTG
ncbi:MAG: 2-isopropylmalate synthase [Nanoarchaeota archaeon]|nr:2-isopropylmalate synthase [Nanoarchaeota archaeon]MBU4116511.1 2-isopropylmalate synthase [Nanoarchaeota archaeon]